MENEPEKFAITDKKGRYGISIVAGTYNLRYTSEGMLPLTILNRLVKASIRGRLNVELQPVRVETLHATSLLPEEHGQSIQQCNVGNKGHKQAGEWRGGLMEKSKIHASNGDAALLRSPFLFWKKVVGLYFTSNSLKIRFYEKPLLCLLLPGAAVFGEGAGV